MAAFAAAWSALRAPTITAATPRPVEHVTARHGGDVDAVAIRDAAAGGQERLEQGPAAEIVDDELVFRERAVFGFARWFRRAEPAVAEEAARHRSVTEQRHVVGAAQRRQAVLRAGVEQGILGLHRDQRHAGVEDRTGVGDIEVGAPRASGSYRPGGSRRARPSCRWRPAPHNPTNGTARGRGAPSAGAATTCRRCLRHALSTAWEALRGRERASCAP